MGRSTTYYRSNPEARKRKAATDKKINARPSQKEKRRELGRKNYEHDKKYGKASRKGKDLSHTPSGLRYMKSSKNRGSSSLTKGDRNARAKGRKHKK